MELIIAIGALVALVWGSVLLVRGGLLAGSLLVLVAGICFGHPFFHIPFKPVPITFDRLLLAVLIAQYVCYRRWGLAEPKPLGKSEVALLGFMGILLASTLTHDWQADRARPLSQLVFFFGMPAVLYWITRQTKITERGMIVMFASFAMFGVYVALTAIAEAQHAWSIVFPRYIINSTITEFLGRGRGPLLNPAGCGMLQGLCLTCAIVWCPRLGRKGAILLGGLSIIYAAGVYSTLTRSAWMGAGLGVLIVVALKMPRAWRMPLMTCALVSAVLLAATNWQRLLAFKRDKDVSAREVEESARLRPILAKVAWNMFRDYPWLGCGYGQYLAESPDYFSDRTGELPLEKARGYVQHNVFLALLVETGLVGLAAFLALLGYWTRSAWRLWCNQQAPEWARNCGLLFLAYASNYAVNGVFHDVSIIPMVNMLLFFLAALVSGLEYQWRCAASMSPSLVGRVAGDALAGIQEQRVAGGY